MIPSPYFPKPNLKGFVDMFAQIAADAQFINSFSFGSYPEGLTEDLTKFPQLYLEVLPLVYDWQEGARISFPAVFYIFDLPEPSQDNRDEAFVDNLAGVEEMAKNVLARIWGVYGEFVGTEYENANILVDKRGTSKEVNYARVEVLLTPPFGLGDCESPFAERIFEPDDC